jgi:hypothetical protein
VLGHKADLGVLALAFVGRADLPPEVHRADPPLLLLVLAAQATRVYPQTQGFRKMHYINPIYLTLHHSSYT